MKSLSTYPESSNHALKEWAIVCEAIQLGRQQLLFRTGGIEESANGFELKNNSFWLFPTRFHQTSELVTDEFASEVARENVFSQTAENNEIPFQVFCQVAEILYVDSFEKLESLQEFHVLKPDILRQRFEYRTPGLYVLVIQSASLPSPVSIQHADHYDGCKSWFELVKPLSTQGLRPVSSKQSIQQIVRSVTDLLGSD
ncbi:DUF1802 family protein [Planctomicrobium sp.]|jgi:hypothetical protein|nr:DUF1802 family protein [Planctomicrobium sp.]MBT5018301.1 DUF1802 family protein [Planctomicrobium sp.]MDB4743125.1 DUF1802 family protein [Planctomicrobium sp.]